MVTIIRVGVVDDHSGVRAGIINLLKGAKDIRVVGEGADGAQAIALVRSKKPDLILLDVELPDFRGDVVMEMIREKQPDIKVLPVSSYSDPEHVRAMVEHGADGYITKDEAPAMLIEAIRSISEGRTWLSPKAAVSGFPLSLPGQNLTERETMILEQMLLDRSESEIAAALGLKETLVAKHVKFLMKKFDVKSVAALKDLARSLRTVPSGRSASPPRYAQ